MASDELAEGLHERVVTRALLQRLEDSALRPVLDRIDPADEPHVLSRHVQAAVERLLRERSSTEQRVSLVNQLLAVLEDADESVDGSLQQLLALTREATPGRPARSPGTMRPSTPLNDAALLTNAPGEPSFGSEIALELGTSDSVDLLCAFVKWHGIRVLDRELRSLRERGVPLRVVTTTYMGGTEPRALDRLVREYGADVRVQYDAQRTRLHAKAWFFHRASGYDTAYVGSSNLSRSALLDGAEWNVRLSRTGTSNLLTKFESTFETYWNNDAFECYDPDRDRDRLDDALLAGRGGGSRDEPAVLSGLELRPWPHQRHILECLQAERELHDRHRNLVVAATGTGKTIVAALDYRCMCQGHEYPRLLFVAHRREILQQSMRAYREALVDPSFGELYADGARPERWQHVFASIQSLTSYGVENIPPDAFDVVVVDEFHHAEAATYRRLLDHLQPHEFLGLTATPERGDGKDVRRWFDGRTAAEIRLWQAIDADLLTPFHYFGVGEDTDLRAVSMRGGRYSVDELSSVFTADDARARLVLKQVQDKVLDPRTMRCLGFCVSVQHAQYMAAQFERAGLAAVALSASSTTTERTEAISHLRQGRLQCIFTVDLFNEGVDIPEVDTLLLLRPTDSVTLYLQQLGRGLRLSEGKPVLTVIDLIGQHRKEYRLDLRFRAMTGSSRGHLKRDVEKSFPFLPSGCQIVLDEVAQRNVLENVKANLRMRTSAMVDALQQEPTDALAEFLQREGLELADVLSRTTFTNLRRKAGQIAAPESPAESTLLNRVKAFGHVDDPDRAHRYAELLDPEAPAYADLSPATQAFARMLIFNVWRDAGGHRTYDDALAQLRTERSVTDEICQVVDISFDLSRTTSVQLPGALADIPLRVHAQYQQSEALAGLDYTTLDRRADSFRQGVLHTTLRGTPVDAFFVTFRKSEADYSPTTLYRDFPISPSLFHWESQSRTTAASPTGQRYLNGTSTVLIFARLEKVSALGTVPYTFLGPASYVSHRGERPIAITWRLTHDMPTGLFTQAAIAV